MILIILQYLGSLFILLATTFRAFPGFIITGFMCSLVGSLLLSIYSFTTHQFGFLVLNFMSVFMSGIGLNNWNKVKIKKKRGKR